MASDHQFKINTPGYVPTADPATSSVLQDIRNSLSGGDNTAGFFNNAMGPLQEMIDLIATSGDSIWLEGDDESGMPVMYVAQGDNNFLSLNIQFADDA